MTAEMVANIASEIKVYVTACLSVSVSALPMYRHAELQKMETQYFCLSVVFQTDPMSQQQKQTVTPQHEREATEPRGRRNNMVKSQQDQETCVDGP